jgi:prepilin-type N-terminal cleavage/methylation domain-containing protein/prepilin-type processing-associated H-X9-DG protein
MSPTRDVRRGFTLVELLVVISIIGVLMGLLLPAINSARESGRKTQCLSNMKNLGYASLQSVEKLRRFPSGGWGPLWVGYPDGGAGIKQPGGWVYNLLPYLEETSLHDLGQGLTNAQDAQMQGALARQIATTQSIMSCPTRRSAQPWPAMTANPNMNPYDPLSTTGATQITGVVNVARGDYAANAGVEYMKSGSGSSATETEQQFGCFLDPTNPTGSSTTASFPTNYADGVANTNGTVFNQAFSWSGVIFQRSNISDGSIKDGQSKTYLIGEKFVDRRHTEDGQYYGDQGNMYSGMGADNYRTTYVIWQGWPTDTQNADGSFSSDPGKPAQIGGSLQAMLNDQNDPPSSVGGSNAVYGCLFGSAHGGIVNFVFCDGSAKSLSTGIDPLTHRYLGERNDGKILDDAMIGQ